MLIPLGLARNGSPISGFLGLSGDADYERTAPAAELILGPSEIAYFRRLQFPRRQRSYLLGRLAVKRAIAGLLNEPELSRLEVVAGVFCQPMLFYPASASPEISLAHSEDLAVGVACQQGHPVGIDLEMLSAERNELFPKVFSQAEFALLTAAGVPESNAGFMLWTVREALSKVLRCGLTVPFEILRPKAVQPPAPGSPLQSYGVDFENFPQYKAHAWIIGTYALAIVTPRKTALGPLPFAALAPFFGSPTA